MEITNTSSLLGVLIWRKQKIKKGKNLEEYMGMKESSYLQEELY